MVGSVNLLTNTSIHKKGEGMALVEMNCEAYASYLVGEKEDFPQVLSGSKKECFNIKMARSCCDHVALYMNHSNIDSCYV